MVVTDGLDKLVDCLIDCRTEYTFRNDNYSRNQAKPNFTEDQVKNVNTDM